MLVEFTPASHASGIACQHCRSGQDQMNEWRSYHVYYSQVDSLVLKCIGPFLRTVKSSLNMYFWERHYAGGAHVRVRFCGSRESLDAVIGTFLPTVQDYLKKFPSPALAKYSAEQAAQLLEMEGEAAEPSELEYRVNSICQWPYRRLESRFVTKAGLELMHEFLRDSNFLAEMILRQPERKRENLLRLYFLVCLFPDGKMVAGAVSFKSHWEGFAATFKSRAVVDRIRASFDDQKDAIMGTMEGVIDSCRRQNQSQDPILAAWLALLREYGDKAMVILGQGEQINYTMDVDESRQYAQAIREQQVEASDFVDSLFADPRFLQAFRHDLGLAWPRVLINFLYLIVSAAGLTMIDKMALCYFAHRAVETRFDCSLNEMLRENIASVVK
jgi:hypothetical protein